MIVKKLKARNVFGYLDFDIDFKKDISFLVGGNGTGKTTALKLMNALVTPSFRALLQISFDSVEIELEENDETIIITSSQEDDKKTLSVNSIDDPIVFPTYADLEFDYFSRNTEKVNDIVETINRNFSDHPVVSKITAISTPIFLGLDRRREGNSQSGSDYFFEREVFLRESNKRARTARRLIKGSLGVSLMEIDFLVQSAYKRLRVLEERQSERLRDAILASTFQYSTFSADDLDETISWTEKSKLIQRQTEIKEALSNIGIKGSRLGIEVDKFFEKLTSLFEQLKEDEKEISLEWLMNKAQIERMSNIVDIIDEHKTKIDNLYKPINDFISTINIFYSESKKKIEIDAVGQLVVIRPNGSPCTIESLSSGERQLLIIFAHAYLNFDKNKSKKNVFIIDEPELSLHLRWQEKFAEIILELSKKSQFILATHSPEIVGRYKNKAVKCR